MIEKLTTLELQKESMHFSAGHFTIFSETEREPMHGHNYHVSVALTTRVAENGLSFDYRFYKSKIYVLCKQLNQTFLMPAYSAYLQYQEDRDYWYFTFNHQKLSFLKSDVTLLPVSNITVEELSSWFITQLTEMEESLDKHHIEKIQVKVFSGPGQSGSALWEKQKS